jgi:hypothetical protein
MLQDISHSIILMFACKADAVTLHSFADYATFCNKFYSKACHYTRAMLSYITSSVTKLNNRSKNGNKLEFYPIQTDLLVSDGGLFEKKITAMNIQYLMSFERVYNSFLHNYYLYESKIF